MKFTHLGIFEGIGGFSLSARWMGWETIAWCEWDPFCRKALKYHFPNAKGHGDIKKTDFTRYAGRVGVLTAGFPCQPVSTAGARKGVKDYRWGWPETRRAIGESRPDWVVLENVAGLFSILEPESLSELERKEVGLFCEDKEYQVDATIERVQQRVIARIVQDIEQDGYLLPKTVEGRPIVLCIPACAVNAPHRRDRVWIVARNSDLDINCKDGRFQKGQEAKSSRICASANGSNARSESVRQGRENAVHGLEITTNAGLSDAPGWQIIEEGQQSLTGREPRSFTATFGGKDDASNTTGCGRVQIDSKPESGQFAQIIPDWGRFPTQSPVRCGNDGISAGLAGITVSRHRRESLKAYGNAIVPQVAYEIFKAIESTR